MTRVAFLDLSSGGASNGKSIADGLAASLKPYRIGLEHHALEVPVKTTGSLPALTFQAGVVILHHPIPDQSGDVGLASGFPGSAVLHLRHTRQRHRIGHRAGLAISDSSQESHLAMGTLWLSPCPGAAELALLLPLVRQAADWHTRDRRRRESLALAEIYAQAPLFAMAF